MLCLNQEFLKTDQIGRLTSPWAQLRLPIFANSKVQVHIFRFYFKKASIQINSQLSLLIHFTWLRSTIQICNFLELLIQKSICKRWSPFTCIITSSYTYFSRWKRHHVARIKNHESKKKLHLKFFDRKSHKKLIKLNSIVT